MPYSSWNILRDEVKSYFSCTDALRQAGIFVYKTRSAIITPPFIRPGSDSKSFGVYDNICIDFTTGQFYDAIDIIALAFYDGNKTKALEHIAGRKIPSSETHSFTYISQADAFSQRVDFWHSELLKNPIVSPNGKDIHILDYLQDRGIDKDTAVRLKLGYSPKTNRLMIPFFNRHHQPCYAAGRYMLQVQNRSFPKYSYLKLDDPEFSEVLDKCIFGIDSVKPGFVDYDKAFDQEKGELVKLSSHHIKYDYLAVCEGMFDVISFRAQGWSAITGKISSKQEREFLDICRQFQDKGQKIFICFDSDKAGQNFQQKTALLLFQHGIDFVAGHLPASITVTREGRHDFGQDIPVKDVSDYYAAGGSLEELVKSARDGMAEIANYCKNEDELYQRFMEGSRFCDRWQKTQECRRLYRR